MARSVVLALHLTCLAFLGFTTEASAAPWHLTKVQMVSPSQGQGWALAITPQGSVLLRTTDGGADWVNVSPKRIWPLLPAEVQAYRDVGAEGIDFCCLSGQTGWVALEDHQDQVVVERTRDGGRHWAKSVFPERVGYFLDISFLDNRHGWILTVSDMASGSTHKKLYRTNDGGQTWAGVTDALPDHVDPSGLTFRTASEGWLAAGYHGSDLVPLYRTNDAGRHWRLQPLPEPAVFQNDGYGNTNPPQFFGPQKRDGSLHVNYVSSTFNRFETVTYLTRDGGEIWHIVLQRRTKNIGRG